MFIQKTDKATHQHSGITVTFLDLEQTNNSMVDAFGDLALCPLRPLRQKKRTIWNQIFLKRENGEESRQPWL